MGPEIGRYIGEQLFKLAILIFIAGALLASALIFGIPWLWEILKPFLHQVTA